jgi:hypothetical protein
MQAKPGVVTRRAAAAAAPAPVAKPAAATRPSRRAGPKLHESKAAQHQAAGQAAAENAVARRTRARRAAAAAEPTAIEAAPPTPLPDIDSGDAIDPLAASDYVAEIYNYYKRVEHSFLVNPDYMAQQVSLELCRLASGAQLHRGVLVLVLLASSVLLQNTELHQEVSRTNVGGAQRQDACHPGGLAGRCAPQVQGEPA